MKNNNNNKIIIIIINKIVVVTGALGIKHLKFGTLKSSITEIASEYLICHSFRAGGQNSRCKEKHSSPIPCHQHQGEVFFLLFNHIKRKGNIFQCCL